jgi:hypothetical protein
MSQTTAKKYYNIYKKEISFAIEDKIFINIKNLRVQKLYKKLTDRYIEPFKISKTVSLNAYELKLPITYKVLYCTFSISLLKPYSRKKNEEPPEPINLNKKDRFQIKNIRKKRGTKKNPQFLIK